MTAPNPNLVKRRNVNIVSFLVTKNYLYLRHLVEPRGDTISQARSFNSTPSYASEQSDIFNTCTGSFAFVVNSLGSQEYNALPLGVGKEPNDGQADSCVSLNLYQASSLRHRDGHSCHDISEFIATLTKHSEVLSGLALTKRSHVRFSSNFLFRQLMSTMIDFLFTYFVAVQ